MRMGQLLPVYISLFFFAALGCVKAPGIDLDENTVPIPPMECRSTGEDSEGPSLSGLFEKAFENVDLDKTLKDLDDKTPSDQRVSCRMKTLSPAEVFGLRFPLEADAGVAVPRRGAGSYCYQYNRQHFRTLNGECNHQNNRYLGSRNTFFARFTPIAYTDGREAMTHHTPNPRVVSNSVSSQPEELVVPNEKGVNDMFWQWGQFIDHDITLSPAHKDRRGRHERATIPVPSGDLNFDPQGRGRATIRFNRSEFRYNEQGIREQVNKISHFLDGSMVYGSTLKRSRQLRRRDGSGQLKTSANGTLMPYNGVGAENEVGNSRTQRRRRGQFFLAGDVRANEQLGLIAIHTLFVREHNNIAYGIKKDNPHLSGDQVFELARAVVIAEIQHITYEEWLPLLLGRRLWQYKGFDPSVDPRISHEFSTVAFRFGHSMLSPQLLRLDESWNPMPNRGHLRLRDAFFSPERILETGIEPVLRGLLAQRAQKVDTMIVDEVRNFLFGRPGAGGIDLASLNMQRSRDHGIPDYNTVRKSFGLKRFDTFEAMTLRTDPVLLDGLYRAYSSPTREGVNYMDHIDPWVGGLAEAHVENALIGPTFWTIILNQFYRLREGDRFWYEAYLPQNTLSWVRKQTLSSVISRNTNINTAAFNESRTRNTFLAPERIPFYPAGGVEK